MGVWKKCDIWQFTSGGEKVDRNTTELTKLQWKALAFPPSVDRFLSLLSTYHTYIKAHSQAFINKYEGDITTFAKAKARADKGLTVGITCVVPTRWALYEMGISGYGGKALISTEKGTFGKYYAGDVKKYFERITKGGPVGKTVKQAVDEGLLKKGDILCYEDLVHISVFSGSGYKMYEGGGGCVVNGHYPNGVLKDNGSYTRKISEVLRWKTSTKEKTTTSTTPKTAATLINQAKAWIGIKEPNHKKIIELYNSHRPLARSYAVKYTDAWCATFVSACAIATGLTDLIPLECSCEKMIALMKSKGIWVENESRSPSPGDIIFYDWQDSGKGDNKGAADHVGIVEKVVGGVITVIEGNYMDGVGRRYIGVNARYIRGYGVPKYDKTTSTTASKPTTTATSTSKKSTTVIAKEVIAGKWGNGSERKRKLTSAGYDYTAVQKEVNKLVR